MKRTHESMTLKGHGNEADFLGFLQKLLPHESLTLLTFRAVLILALNSIFEYEYLQEFEAKIGTA